MKVLESAELDRMCHYQQNLPQHYHLLDTLVLNVIDFTSLYFGMTFVCDVCVNSLFFEMLLLDFLDSEQNA